MRPNTLVFIMTASLALSSHALTIGLAGTQPEALGYKNGDFVGKYAPIIRCFHDQVSTDSDRVIELPIARQLMMLEKGGLDVSYALAKSPERDKIALASKPLIQLEAWLLTKKDRDPEYQKIQKVATVRGSLGIAEIKNMGAIYVQVNDYNQALRLLNYDRVDAALIPAEVAVSLPADILEKMRKDVIASVPLVVYASYQTENAAEIIARYDRAIENCNGTAGKNSEDPL